MHAREVVVREGFGGVEAGFDGFLLHGTCGRLEGYEQGEVGFFALHIRFERGDLAALHVAALDLHDDALRLAAVVVEEVDVAVYAGVRALLAVARGAGIDQSERPPLELVAVVEREGLGAGQVFRLADDLVGAQVFAERVVQAVADERDGEMRDVDADPAAVQALGGGDRSSAAAEGSSTTSPSLLDALMMRSSNASGFWVG